MKRLSIEFQHREVTISVDGSPLRVQERDPGTTKVVAVCPVCGGSWIAVVAHADGDAHTHVEQLFRSLEQFGLHLQVTPTGDLRICQKSFEELKEKF